MNLLKNTENQTHELGFTLIELLVAIAIVSIVLAAIVGTFEKMSRSYTTQNALASLQQGVRSTLDVIADDIRMAGYNPRRTPTSFGIERANAFNIRLTADRDEDGNITIPPPGVECDEIVSYFYSPANGGSVVKRTCEARPRQRTATLLGGLNDPINVNFINFTYLDQNNAQTTIRSAIRAIQISISAQAPAGRDGMVARTYQTRIECRNLM